MPSLNVAKSKNLLFNDQEKRKDERSKRTRQQHNHSQMPAGYTGLQLEKR